MQDQDEELDDRLLHRMLFFTDAVFAIVLTLLALELRPPEHAAEANAETLGALGGHIFAFTVSFFLIAIFWTAHMNTTRRLARFDWPTALANILYLFPVCLLPFASGWFGASPAGDYAWGLYCSVLVVSSAANMLLVAVVYRGGGRLIAGGSPKGELGYRLARAAAPGVAFGSGLIGLLAGLTILAHFCWVLIPLTFWGAEVALKPRAVKVEAEKVKGEPTDKR